jgi:hypothetical protein
MDAARSSMLDLRRATAELVAQLVDRVGPIERPIRLAERLDLDRSLAWKVWKIAYGPSALPSAAHLPGAAAYRRFIERCEAAGVSGEQAAAAQQAFDHLAEVMTTHGGDRASGAIMLSAISDTGRARIEMSMRRAAFRANSHFLGVQVATCYQLDILLPGPTGMRPTLLRLRGFFGLKRTRSDVAWLLGRNTPAAADGPLAGARREPLSDAASPHDSAGVVARFSSSPLPSISRRVIGGVTVEDELAPGHVGVRGLVDIVMAERVSGLPVRGGPRHAMIMMLTAPCERVIHEVIVADGLIRDGLQLNVHSLVNGELPYLRGPNCDAIPVPETISAIGRPDQVAPLAGVPRHSAMLQWMLSRAGYPAEQMTLWRSVLKFPPIPSCLAAVMDQHIDGQVDGHHA